MDITNDPYLKSTAAIQIQRLHNDKQRRVHEEGSRKLLLDSIDKRIKTTMIGSISRVESMFGYLWGHDLGTSDYTDEQIEIKNLWDDLRVSILNNGNDQIRKMRDEINHYTISLNDIKNKLPINKN